MEHQTVTLKGVVERITYTNPDNGYTIARFQASGRFGMVTLVGALAEVHPGARLKVEGRWKTHPKYGEQFEIIRYVEEMPATTEGIKRYLGSGLIKGIGPKMARRIAEHFGAYTLDVIENEIHRLNEVDGIGYKRVKLIAQAWEAQKQIKEIMIFLQGHQVSTTLAVKIYKTYGDNAIPIVQETPYRLARDIYGIGFLTADKIARSLGIEPDAPQRVAAGIEYTLNQLADQGHVYAPRDHLIEAAVKILDVMANQVDAQIDGLQQEDRIKVEDLAKLQGRKVAGSQSGRETRLQDVIGKNTDNDNSATPHSQPPPANVQLPITNYQSPNLQSPTSNLQPLQAVYLNPFYFAEVGVAQRASRLLASPESRLGVFQEVAWHKAFDWVAGRTGGITLADRQREAVQMALTQKVAILTGGPGTGKTSTVKAILELLTSKGKSALLAAPTGRAAKRLAESTGREAKTIHRLLEVSPSEGFKFQRNQDNPLECDLLILDECSMIDLMLMNNVLKAVHPASHLLLVGDADQLPSVGAGNVLRDLIGSGVIPVTRLEVIFRQAADSTIITNAHRINQGQTPIYPKSKHDFYFFGKEEPAEAADLVVDIVDRRIPHKFGIPPPEIQVLTPMHRGSAGARTLNEKLQAQLNPLRYGQPEYRSGSRLFRVSDRVLQLRNNYDKDVFNGDIGAITRIDLEEGEVVVEFEGRPVTYEFSDLDELTLAYAMSVHKSQGSEYPVVVLPMLTQHYMLLQRNLLYTAITRAKKMVVIVGTRKAVAMAVGNDKITARWSALIERLRSETP
ncbi:MAG: AAA family ATPase [Anaerolineaceae bacterium]|nr:AAA family ATPase [Anaerolineaceae bacterium]MCB9099089.1 AAA family ATPase [Anaerolineales bacterium]